MIKHIMKPLGDLACESAQAKVAVDRENLSSQRWLQSSKRDTSKPQSSNLPLYKRLMLDK